jgi:DNA repair exonuclease SbcCD ATPase subunit
VWRISYKIKTIKNTEDYVMKTTKNQRLTIIVAAVLLAVLIGAGMVILNKNSQVNELKMQNTNLSMTIEKRDSLVNEFENTFNEIEESLTFIKERRNNLTLASKEELTSNRKGIVEDIKLMNTMLAESSEKINELNKKLNSEKFRINSLNTRIEELTNETVELISNIEQLESKLSLRNNEIAEMDNDIIQLKNEIDKKDETILVKSQTIAEKDAKINKVFFIKGSFKELEQKKIVDREGGFLGLGRNIIIQDNFSDEYFTELDKREVDTIPLNSQKVEIISVHSEDSYSFDNDGDQLTYLKIEKPDEFWKVSNYLVVRTK